MAGASKYVAKQPDSEGYIHYHDDEHRVWHDLLQTQYRLFPQRVCDEYLAGLEYLNLPFNRIPQCSEISEHLFAATGWQVTAVPALIDFTRFFTLLSQKTFPVATFIRSREEIDYLQEPDIFHEVVGHTPLLTQHVFAEFTHRIGLLGASLPETYHVWLARLYWMTIEFGLINTRDGLRAYGAGIASSSKELIYSLSNTRVIRKPFDFLSALRTAYRIDILQPIYFVLQDFQELLDVNEGELVSLIEKAMFMGLDTHE